MVSDGGGALGAQFDRARSRLQSVAYRMLGSHAEAEDAVQEAWLRLSRADSGAVVNLEGWLTTVVARICLDMLRTRESRREDPLDEILEPGLDTHQAEIEGDEELILAESLGAALIVVLETLAPAERLAFVLHDLFAVPFEEIAQVLGKSPTAARQLASRARRRVQSKAAAAPNEDRTSNRSIVAAFLAASRDGDFGALLAILDPDAVLRADAAAIALGAPADANGADAVARTFAGRARAAQLALLGDEPGVVWAMRGTPRVAFAMTIRNGRIAAIRLIADTDHLQRLDIRILE